jgi:hypothetical protein
VKNGHGVWVTSRAIIRSSDTQATVNIDCVLACEQIGYLLISTKHIGSHYFLPQVNEYAKSSEYVISTI